MKKVMGKMARLALSAALLLGVSSNAMALTLDFASVVGAEVEFTGTGDTFTFNDGIGGYDFGITLSDGVGDAVGLSGNIGGVFTIGSITTSGLLQTASVSGSSGSFSINDGVSSVLTGNLSWVDIYTVYGGGAINAGGTVNLTNIVYTGLNNDLLQFVTGGDSGIVTSSFQFVPAQTLTALTTDGASNNTSYSGTVSVPEPSTLLLLGSGLVGLGFFGRRKKV